MTAEKDFSEDESMLAKKLVGAEEFLKIAQAAQQQAEEKQVKGPAWRVNFDERQNKEIDFCIVYRNQFNNGHILRTIIADMASILNRRRDS